MIWKVIEISFKLNLNLSYLINYVKSTTKIVVTRPYLEIYVTCVVMNFILCNIDYQKLLLRIWLPPLSLSPMVLHNFLIFVTNKDDNWITIRYAYIKNGSLQKAARAAPGLRARALAVRRSPSTRTRFYGEFRRSRPLIYFSPPIWVNNCPRSAPPSAAIHLATPNHCSPNVQRCFGSLTPRMVRLLSARQSSANDTRPAAIS